MKLWEILVPASTADHPIKLAHHKAWDNKVRAIAGGLTIMRPAKGEWISPSGKLFRDRMIPVRIMCNTNEIEKIAKITIEHYNEEAVMFYSVSDHVQIRYAAEYVVEEALKQLHKDDVGLTPEEISLIAKGKIIAAIKMLRYRTGMNLKECKNLIDKFRQH